MTLYFYNQDLRIQLQNNQPNQQQMEPIENHQHVPYYRAFSRTTCGFCKDNNATRPTTWCSICEKPYHITGTVAPSTEEEGKWVFDPTLPNTTPNHIQTPTCWSLAHKQLIKIIFLNIYIRLFSLVGSSLVLLACIVVQYYI